MKKKFVRKLYKKFSTNGQLKENIYGFHERKSLHGGQRKVCMSSEMTKFLNFHNEKDFVPLALYKAYT